MSSEKREATPAGSGPTSHPSPIIRPAVDDRGWGPTILLCVAVLLAAVIVVVAKPLSAGASPTRSHATGRTVTARPARDVAKVSPGVATSPNWSGYVVYAKSINNGSFDQVSAQWTEPVVTCPKANAWALFWVGFDGWPSTDRSVEQGGTSAQCIGGVPHYSAFYEMWPTMAVTQMFSINAGDQIAADVIYTPLTQQFLITVTDNTSGQTLTESVSCPPNQSCARTSAEWVAESPSHFGTDKWFPLANYGTVTFTGATATDAEGNSGPISNPVWVDSGIERVAGRALAKVSSLQNSGYASAFADTWQRK